VIKARFSSNATHTTYATQARKYLTNAIYARKVRNETNADVASVWAIG